MAIFQCQHCGTAENSALGLYWGHGKTHLFDWTGVSERKGLKLCSGCGPTKYSDGKPTKFGRWHEQFDRVYLPMDLFVTDSKGYLVHRYNGDTDLERYRLRPD